MSGQSGPAAPGRTRDGRRLRVGRIPYINCYPVYGAVDRGLVPLDAELVDGIPTALNARMARGLLDVSVVSAVDLPIGSGVGERIWRVSSVDELESTYELGAGEAELDLRDVVVSGTGRDVRVRVGFGELRVVVPNGVPVAVDTHNGAGEIQVFGETRSGLDLDLAVTEGEAPLLRLDVELGAGELTVRRAKDSPPRPQNSDRGFDIDIDIER